VSVWPQIQECYDEMVRLDALKIPYVYGGATLKGLDCSKADSWVLKAGGILTALMGTHELERTPELADGVGLHLTLWVANTALLEHSLLEATMPGKGQQFWAARTKGTTVGFFDLPSGREYLIAAGFKPRRRP
jgi:hypothetical protein